MSNIDYILLTPLVFGLGYGLIKGLVRELMSLITIVAGVIAAKFFSEPVKQVLEQSFSIPDMWAGWIAYLVMFLAVVALCSTLKALITKLVSSLDLGWLNRLAGGVFGMLKWALIVSVCLNLLLIVEQKIPIIKPEAKEQSAVYKPLLKLAATAWQYIDVNNTDASEQTDKCNNAIVDTETSTSETNSAGNE